MTDRTNSKLLFDRAQKVIPGGVNSPVRAFGAVGGQPPFISRGKGAEVIDADGHHYIDFCCSWGPLILGHAHPKVLETITTTARRGTSFGASTELEVELAEFIVDKVDAVEKVRCVSSGTEAVMSAVRLARGVTGRDKIIKFSGCYHGHVDYLLVSAGSGLATFGKPSSAGVPDEFAGHTLVAELDDEEAVEALFKKHGDDIAAVLIEPIPANNGLLLQRGEYLKFLRDICTKHGALLIFDEVISGFRVGWNGAAGKYGITPDLMTFGKVIGGGMPVGAFGGRSEIMAHLAPEGNVYQAGTLSGNPVAMAAGLETLKILASDDAFSRLDDLGTHFENVLTSHLTDIEATVLREGSIVWIVLQSERPRRASEISTEAIDRFNRIHRFILDRGVYLPPSGYEVLFISLAHTTAQLSQAATTLGKVFTSQLQKEIT